MTTKATEALFNAVSDEKGEGKVRAARKEVDALLCALRTIADNSTDAVARAYAKQALGES